MPVLVVNYARELYQMHAKVHNVGATTVVAHGKCRLLETVF